MNDPPEALSAQNAAEEETWPDMDPSQQQVQARIWGPPPETSSDAA